VVLKARFKRGAVKIAHKDQGHVIGAVPGLVKIHQPLRRGGLDYFRQADGRAVRVGRAPEKQGQHFLPEPFIGAAAEPGFLQHH
jgi:hypothetical protein